MKDLVWSKFGEMPNIDHNGTYYRIEHTLTLGMLKRISDHDSVLSVNGICWTSLRQTQMIYSEVARKARAIKEKPRPGTAQFPGAL